MASPLVATQATLILRRPVTTLYTNQPAAALPPPSARIHRLLPLSKPNFLPFSPLPKPSKLRISASISPALKNPVFKSPDNTDPVPDLLSGSTRTVTTVVGIAVAASRFFAGGLFTLAVQIKEPLLHTAGPAFFAAAARERLHTPFTVVAAGMAKWMDLYGGVLMVRVLLSWFPNIHWERQPLSAIRDLCDPYLGLFRGIIPPLFDTLDISPLFAFAVLGCLGGIMRTARFG